VVINPGLEILHYTCLLLCLISVDCGNVNQTLGITMQLYVPIKVLKYSRSVSQPYWAAEGVWFLNLDTSEP
jgi:hypothetical protein